MTKAKCPVPFDITPEEAAEIAADNRSQTPDRRAHFEGRRLELADWIARNGRLSRDRADGALPSEHMMRIRYVVMTSAGVEIAA